jgi:hypothetical protein
MLPLIPDVTLLSLVIDHVVTWPYEHSFPENCSYQEKLVERFAYVVQLFEVG